MTPILYQLKQVLLPTLIETVVKQRKEPVKVENKELMERLERLENEALTAVGASGTAWSTFFRAAVSAATGTSIPNKIENLNFSPMTVIVQEKVTNSCPYPAGKPLLLTKGGSYLQEDGRVGDYVADLRNSRLATDEEIESLLDNLNEKQVRKILRDSHFEPYIAALFQETELVPETELKEEDIQF